MHIDLLRTLLRCPFVLHTHTPVHCRVVRHNTNISGEMRRRHRMEGARTIIDDNSWCVCESHHSESWTASRALHTPHHHHRHQPSAPGTYIDRSGGGGGYVDRSAPQPSLASLSSSSSSSSSVTAPQTVMLDRRSSASSSTSVDRNSRSSTSSTMIRLQRAPSLHLTSPC